MIRQTKAGYKVVSEKGKNLSADNLTHAQAKKRLKQIEYFKHINTMATLIQSGSTTYVKAHKRNGKMVKAHTRTKVTYDNRRPKIKRESNLEREKAIKLFKGKSWSYLRKVAAGKTKKKYTPYQKDFALAQSKHIK